MKTIFYSALVASILSSCGNETPEATPDKALSTDTSVTKISEPVCKKGYDIENTIIGFKAYKTTEKLGVGGVFNEFKISNTEVADSPEEIFAKASFHISVASLETKDPGRNDRIKEHFFGKMSNTNNIKGQVVSFNTDSNKVDISLNLNGVQKDVTFDYKIAGDTIKVSGSINILDFDASESLAALNKVCESLHMGADGISKTWPDVSISISSVIKETCK